MTRQLLSTLVMVLSCASVACSQETLPQPDSARQTLRTESNLVLVPVLVKNEQGGIVYGLRGDDFVVQDDGIAQQAHLDESAETEPISLVIAIQTGRTASAEFERMHTINTMLEPVLRQSQSQAAVVIFDSHVTLAQDFTSNSVLIRRSLDGLRPGDGGAAIFDAVNLSAGLLNGVSRNRQRVLLLISETRDHGSVFTIDDVVAQIGNSNIAVYTLAFSPTTSNILDDLRGKLERKGDSVNLGDAAIKLLIMAREAMRKNAPKEIARLTGGEYELFRSHRGFESRMVDFANHIHNRYLLSFAPQDPHPGLHEIQVKLKNYNAVSIFARAGYWSK